MRRVCLGLVVLASGCVQPTEPAPAPRAVTPVQVSEPEPTKPEPKAPSVATAAEGQDSPVVALAESRLPRYVTISAGRVYWSNGAGEITSVALGGGDSEIHYRPGPRTRALARVVTSDGDKIYFTTREGIHRLSPRSGEVGMQVRVSEALYVAVDDRFLYYTRFGTHGIWRAPKNGSGKPIRLARTRMASSLTPSGEYLYWTSYSEGTINRVHRHTRRRSVLARARHPTGLTLVGGQLLWSMERGGKIQALNLGQKRSRPRTIVRGAKNHDVLASDDRHVYWGSWLPEGKGTVYRIEPTGGDVEVLAVELRSPVGLAVSGEHLIVANKGEGTILKIDKP